MPMGAPSHVPPPKSVFTELPEKFAMIWLLYGSVGSDEISLFHGLSTGKISVASRPTFEAAQEMGCWGLLVGGCVDCPVFTSFLHERKRKDAKISAITTTTYTTIRRVLFIGQI